MGKTYSNAFRFASVNADMVAGGLVLVAVFERGEIWGPEMLCAYSINYR